MRFIYIANVALLSAVLTGCGGMEEQSINDYIDEVKKTKITPIKPLPEAKAVDSFIYLAGTHRNPFAPDKKPDDDKSLLLGGVSSGIHPDILRSKEALESYGLDSLKMVGVVSLRKVKWALVKAPDGVIMKVKAGNYLGKSDGKIESISNTEISIMEILPDKKPHTWVNKEAKLLLEIADSHKNSK